MHLESLDTLDVLKVISDLMVGTIEEDKTGNAAEAVINFVEKAIEASIKVSTVLLDELNSKKFAKVAESIIGFNPFNDDAIKKQLVEKIERENDALLKLRAGSTLLFK